MKKLILICSLLVTCAFSHAQTVTANMEERFIFNFRIKPEILAKHLPSDLLKPQIVNGYSIVSFCVLKLNNIVVKPIPSFLGYNSTSCAYRIGVIDKSEKTESNSVYIVERYTDRGIISTLAPKILSDNIPIADTKISEKNGYIYVTTTDENGKIYFSAKVKKTNALNSKLFADPEDFKSFIKQGVSSYTPSSKPNMVSRVDLVKKDNDYTPLNAEIISQNFSSYWEDADLEFDSALHTTGGKYTWTNKGLKSTKPNIKKANISNTLAKKD
jgi:hypothetical protein